MMLLIDSLAPAVPILAADPNRAAVAFRLVAAPSLVVVVAYHPAAAPIPAVGACLHLT